MFWILGSGNFKGGKMRNIEFFQRFFENIKKENFSENFVLKIIILWKVSWNCWKILFNSAVSWQKNGKFLKNVKSCSKFWEKKKKIWENWLKNFVDIRKGCPKVLSKLSTSYLKIYSSTIS